MALFSSVCNVRRRSHGTTGRVGRCTVGVDRAAVSQGCEEARQGTAADRGAADHERRVLDSAHRCALEGLTGAIPAVPDLPSTVPALGANRSAGEEVLKALARQLKDESDFDLEECFIDGSFVGAKKGALPSARPSGARVRSSWQWQTALALRWPYSSNPRVRTKSSSSTPRSMRASPRTNRSG